MCNCIIKKLPLVPAVLLLAIICIPAHAAIIHVDRTATGANDGTSWTDAYADLQIGLMGAVANDSIWVAGGTYRPAAGADRDSTFQLVNDVAIYGGFAGTETDLSERDWSTNWTILSGDIGVVDVDTDNSYHVVTGSGTVATAVLDGFTIARGYADHWNTSDPRSLGGGMYSYGGSPTLVNVVFYDNASVYNGGGGMFNRNGSNPALTNVTFSANTTDNRGGGMYNYVNSNPALVNVTFVNNSAANGGGMFNHACSPTLTDVTFTGNEATGTGGSDGGGGMYNYLSSNPTLTNVTFSGNSTDMRGGGLYNQAGCYLTLANVVFRNNTAGWGGGMFSDASSVQLTNTTFSGNIASAHGGGIYDYESNVALVNTILWGNSASTSGNEIYNFACIPAISYCLIEGSGGSGGSWDTALGADGGGNLDADPLFVDEPGGDLRQSGFASPAVNAGNNAASGLPATDLDGNERIAAAIVDLGAYEYPAACPPGNVLYVDKEAVGVGDGSSWADALPELRHAYKCTHCPDVTEIWVAAGTYRPTAGADPDSTFQLVNGMAIYGGFAGTETNSSERDWSTNVTVLSGDIGVVDDSTDNSFHVVTGSGTDATAVLDGFTITRGCATTSDPRAMGGGMYSNGGSPTLVNVIFTGNIAINSGGGWTFNGGGGMFNGWSSSPTLVNVVFERNFTYGCGGGLYNYDHSNPTLVNVTFSDNSAGLGGGLANNASCYPTLVNTVLWGNSASVSGNEIYNFGGSTPAISYCLIAGSGGSGGSWDTALGTDSGNNLDADPMFVDELDGDLHLSSPLSPAFNAGNNAAPGLPATDLDGNPRIAAGIVDMGAYEVADLAWTTAFPSPLVFPTAPGYETTCDTIRIVNDGALSCTIDGILGCDMVPFSVDTTMTVHALAPGDTTEIVVCVTPATADLDTCYVTIVSDAWNSPTSVQVRIDAVTSVGPDRTPRPFRIVTVAPNPFNPSTTVHFTLPAAMPVTATIYSVTGARVRVLAAGARFEAGENRLVWNGRTDRGAMVASGLYFVRIKTPVGTEVARALMLK